MKLGLLLLAATASSPLHAQEASEATSAVTLQIDATHSELVFRIRHWSSRVSGTFEKWGGTIVHDTVDFSKSTVEISIETASIDTNNDGRDDHLRSDDFFDAEKYPKITFESTKIEGPPEKFTITGNLDMHGVTRTVVLTGRFVGPTPTRQGLGAGFEASTKIDRTKFGVSYNRIVEGITRLGDDVEISIAIQAVPPSGGRGG